MTSRAPPPPPPENESECGVSLLSMVDSVDNLRSQCFSSYLDGNFSDVLLICGDGGSLRLHQMILASVSPLIKRSLKERDPGNGGGEEDYISIIIPDFNLEEVKYVMEIVYGRIPKKEEELQEPLITSDLIRTLAIGHWTTKIQSDDHSDYDQNHGGGGGTNKSIKSTGRKKKFDQLNDGKWKCLTCGAIVNHRHQFNGHYEKEHGNGSIEDSTTHKLLDDDDDIFYGVIDQVLDHEEKLEPNAQEKNHSLLIIKKLACHACSISFESHESWNDHLIHFCPSSASFELSCPSCDLSFNDYEKYKTHFTLTNCASPFFCDTCKQFWNLEIKYNIHNFLVHQEELRCSPCDDLQQFTNLYNYCQHMSESPHIVSDKPMSFTKQYSALDNENNIQQLTYHNLDPEIEKEKFYCEKCDKYFKNKSTLTYHISSKHVNKNRDLICPQCDRKFKSLRGLKYHINIHNGVADYLCDDCGRGFITRQKLINHRRSKHTFEKPYICDQCGDGFVRSDKLVIHRRRAHSFEKPYQCEFCEWRGVDSSSLIHHKKKHANERNKLAIPKQLVESHNDILGSSTEMTSNPIAILANGSSPSQIQQSSIQTCLRQQQHHQDYYNLISHQLPLPTTSNATLEPHQQNPVKSSTPPTSTNSNNQLSASTTIQEMHENERQFSESQRLWNL